MQGIRGNLIMKIGIDTLFETPGKGTGGITYLINFISKLAKIDQENEYFIFVSKLARPLFEVKQENFHYIECPYSNEKRKLRVINQHLLIPFYIIKFGIDVLNSPGNVSPLYVPCCSVLTIKTMHHYQTQDQMDPYSKIYRRIFVKISAQRADMIIANSMSNKNDICHFLKVPKEKVVIVLEAVNSEQFIPISKEKVLPSLLNYGIQNPYLLFVSALWPYKNALGLVKAFHILVKKYNISHSLVIVGGGWESYKQEIIIEAKRSAIINRIIFPGHIDNKQINTIYSGADVFVYPSYYETFGLTVLEAMAAGIPVVASNRSSIPEIVGDAGLLVNPDNIEQMAEAIYHLISQKDLREKYIRKGLERAKLFTWEKTARETLDVYKEAFKRYRYGG